MVLGCVDSVFQKRLLFFLKKFFPIYKKRYCILVNARDEEEFDFLHKRWYSDTRVIQ